MIKSGDNSNNKERYIRTTNGYKLKSDFLANNNMNLNNNMNITTTLPYEHICQNLCEFISPKQSLYFTQNEDISLKNITDISQDIFSSMKNLYLESDSSKAADEVSMLKSYNCGLIVDATTKANGQNLKQLREISKISGVDICFGYTLKNDFGISSSNINNLNNVNNFNSQVLSFDPEKALSEIRYEIAYGYEDLIPSFLGEIIISSSNIFPNKNEDAYLNILFKVVKEFNIPLFIKLNHSFNNNKSVYEYFLKQCQTHGVNTKLIVFILALDPEELPLLEFIKTELLDKGFSLIIGLYQCDLINNSKCGVNIPQYYSKEILQFVKSLLNDGRYTSQLMISNNINFRLQLKKYGGFGYVNLFRNYYDKIIEGLKPEDLKMIFSENLLNLLSYWEPPKKVEKRVKLVTCTK